MAFQGHGDVLFHITYSRSERGLNTDAQRPVDSVEKLRGSSSMHASVLLAKNEM